MAGFRIAVLVFPGFLLLPFFCFGEISHLKTAEGKYLLRGSKEIREFQITSEGFPARRPAKYDPILWTVAAGLKSRSFDRGQNWQDFFLPWPEPSRTPYYRKPVPAHRSVTGESETLVILFSATYSTWKRGSWVNQLVSQIRRSHPSTDFLAIGGFLTQEMLAAEPRFPPLGGEEIAEDLYQRLSADLQRTRLKYKKILLMGASGSASLIVQLLAQDAEQGIFNGGIAFSPVVDLPHAYQVLDQTVDAITAVGKFPPKMGLTNLAPESLGMLLEGAIRRGTFDPTPSPEEVLSLAAFDSSAKIRARALLIKRLFFNEFIATDLHDTSLASHSPDFRWNWEAQAQAPDALAWNEGNRYQHYFSRYAFARHQQEGRVAQGESFAAYTDFLKPLARVRAPLYVVFSTDDPVLSKNELSALSAPLATLKRIADLTQINDQIHFFNPPFGGHMGYFLDENWMKEVLNAFLDAR